MRKLIFTVFLLWTVVCGLWTITYAEIPRLINYQGRLTDKEEKPVADGTYSITFRIYNDKDELKWEEKDVMVPVEKGIFSVLLGSKVNLGLPFNEPYFLEIQVEDDEPLKPKQQIASAGYAIRAEKAGEADKATQAQNANQAQNADTVANIGVSTTPQANKLLPLDNNAKLPLSTLGLKVYDSGWFRVQTGNSYTKNHNLGTTKVLVTVQFSQNADGSNPVISNLGEINNDQVGAVLSNFTNTQITYDISGSPHGWAVYWDGYILYSSGYMRIIMLALE